MFGDQLRTHRAAAGLTQEELAERTGLSRRGIADLERGARRSPHPDTVRRLGQALALDNTELAAMLAARQAAPPTAASDLAQLPTPLTSFLGRARELAEGRRLLRTTRLLTMVGTGGVGKTRLALEVARGSAAEYQAGAALVELAALADAALVPQAVASAWVLLKSRANRCCKRYWPRSVGARYSSSWTTANTWFRRALSWPRACSSPVQAYGS